jgi:large subunit ribosomal protein L26e
MAFHKWVIYIELIITREKVNRSTVDIGINPFMMVITNLRLDNDNKAKGSATADKECSINP